MADSPPVNLKAARSNKLTRRSFLGLAAGGVSAALSGCLSSSESHPALAAVQREKPVTASAPSPSRVASTEPNYAPPPGFQAPPYKPPVEKPFIPSTDNGVIPRSVWTRVGFAKPAPLMGGVNLLTFHHDGDDVPFAQDDYWLTARYLEAIRVYHAGHGFQDIGYHFAIDRAGRVWELRPQAYRGEHVRDGYDLNHKLHKWNDHNIGVVVLGNFMLQLPTAAQKKKICSFGALLRSQYKLSIAQVKVHQELVSTECPGIHLRPYMNDVRSKRLI